MTYAFFLFKLDKGPLNSNPLLDISTKFKKRLEITALVCYSNTILVETLGMQRPSAERTLENPIQLGAEGARRKPPNLSGKRIEFHKTALCIFMFYQQSPPREIAAVFIL